MMCEFHESTCNGFGDIWWTDNPIYFSSVDVYVYERKVTYIFALIDDLGGIFSPSCCQQLSLSLNVSKCENLNARLTLDM